MKENTDFDGLTFCDTSGGSVDGGSVINLNSCVINHDLAVVGSTIRVNSTSGGGEVQLTGNSTAWVNTTTLGKLKISNNDGSNAIISNVKNGNFQVNLQDACNGVTDVDQNSGDFRIASKNFDNRLIEKLQTISDILQHCYNTDNSGPCSNCGSPASGGSMAFGGGETLEPEEIGLPEPGPGNSPFYKFSNSTWTVSNDLPEYILCAHGITCNEKGYICGDIYNFEYVSNTFTQKSWPDTSYNFSISSLNNKIYYNHGRWDAQTPPHDDGNREYNPQTDTFTTDMDGYLSEGNGAFVVNEKIHVFGGGIVPY